MIVHVHNISDRPNTPGDPVSVVLGGQKLRPGKRLAVDDSVLNAKHRELHGTRLWIGDELPARFARTSRSALAAARRAERDEIVDAPALTLEQVRAELDKRTADELLDMALHASPPVEFSGQPSKAALVMRLSRALFQPERDLDPEVFFWLGRWRLVRGDYVSKE